MDTTHKTSRRGHPPTGRPRHRGLATLAVAVAVVAGACGGDDDTDARSAADDPEPASTVASTASRPASGEGSIPDGNYAKVSTVEDGITLGLDPEQAEAQTGPDGEMPIRIVIDGDRWFQYGTNDLGIEELGDQGSSEYDGDGNWIACPGCTAIEWSLSGGELTLRFADSGEAVPDDARFVMEGTYHLDGSSEPVTDEAVTLRFAYWGDGAPPQLVAFVEEVQRLAGGAIEFEWLPKYGIDPSSGAYSDAEAVIVSDVAGSTIDIGLVGVRSLPGFEALLAPLLVDGHDLQERVFEVGIPERMLADLNHSGLVGITVLPGPLRRMMGVEHPFTAPADFAGAVVANDRAPLAEATMTALGATSTAGADGLSLDGIDAVLAQFQAIGGNGYETQADSVAANLVFWPRPLGIVMSADSFAALTPEQQDVLLTAGANTVDVAMQASRDEDADTGAELCDAPIAVIEATEAELAEFATALEPVYADLRSDPTTAVYLDEIRALKEELGAPPATLTC
jgi:TRAP-type C4-dicarboxylate transport system substrate-binding protein